MKHYTYTVHIEPAEEGGYVASVPTLPGCHTQGETYEETVRMAQDAIACYLQMLTKLNEPIPQEEHPAEHVVVGIPVEVVSAS